MNKRIFYLWNAYSFVFFSFVSKKEKRCEAAINWRERERVRERDRKKKNGGKISKIARSNE